jgi:hypothetical protein
MSEGYFRLLGSDADGALFDNVIQSKSITLGRTRSQPTQNTMGIGIKKTLSREHLRIHWNGITACWELHILGKAGAKVNGEKLDHGVGPVLLKSKDLLEAEGSKLSFLLPYPEIPPKAFPNML